MSDNWVSQFFNSSSVFPSERDVFSPFSGVRRIFDEFERVFSYPNYTRNVQTCDFYKFGEGSCEEMTNKDGEFSIKMDVSHFAPNELKVDIVDRCLVVEGKHDERNDNCGSIKRMFVRKYLLPSGVKEDDVTSELTRDGFLTIKAKNQEYIENNKVRNVPITYN
ncbi:Protein lethal(2)essential for life [Strongyloides ratti]|uniref:Protein lethal(2)essential for life n=1 Tax=Strongyloides ratti TaxID=34506 RepID=A0A090N0A5_STRRB|nr:Protein lethal(2)essential for life [Strongyloides ratti]CEF70345.1 Protein lethal(2)essential for life [Strongyloides ratti]